MKVVFPFCNYLPGRDFTSTCLILLLYSALCASNFTKYNVYSEGISKCRRDYHRSRVRNMSSCSNYQLKIVSSKLLPVFTRSQTWLRYEEMYMIIFIEYLPFLLSSCVSLGINFNAPFFSIFNVYRVQFYLLLLLLISACN